MPTIRRFERYGLKAYMYPDHNPPHAHIIGPNGEVRIRLRDLEPMDRTELRSAELALARDWIHANIDQLRAEWESLNARD